MGRKVSKKDLGRGRLARKVERGGYRSSKKKGRKKRNGGIQGG